MENCGSLTRWAKELHSHDAERREEAAKQIWLRFAERLRRMIRRRLDPRILHRSGGDDDVLNSLFASFFAAAPGPLGPPRCRAELWRLLVHFTICKIANTADYHQAKRRDVRRETPLPDGRDGPWDIADRRAMEPAAEVIAREEFSRLLALLPEDLQQVFAMRLDGYTNAEIATQLGRVERTIELRMRAIRGLLRPHLGRLLGTRMPT